MPANQKLVEFINLGGLCFLLVLSEDRDCRLSLGLKRDEEASNLISAPAPEKNKIQARPRDYEKR